MAVKSTGWKHTSRSAMLVLAVHSHCANLPATLHLPVRHSGSPATMALSHPGSHFCFLCYLRLQFETYELGNKPYWIQWDFWTVTKMVPHRNINQQWQSSVPAEFTLPQSLISTEQYIWICTGSDCNCFKRIYFSSSMNLSFWAPCTAIRTWLNNSGLTSIRPLRIVDIFQLFLKGFVRAIFWNFHKLFRGFLLLLKV